MTKIVAVDTGGTFTDIVILDADTNEISISKTSTYTDQPAENIAKALKDCGIRIAEIDIFIHATTIGTNALLERKGARTGFLTNRGFRDIIFIQRGDQERSYDLQWIKPKPLVMRKDCKEIRGRMNYEGEVLQELDVSEVREAVKNLRNERVRTIAVALLFSYLNPLHELKVREIVKYVAPEMAVSLSHEVYPRWREYNRFSTTIADAYLKPVFSEYISSLSDGLMKRNKKLRILIMKSNGGITDWQSATEHPAESIMSGPVGGVLAANYLSRLLNQERIISMDIGGTSCDISLIEKGNQRYTTDFMLEFGIPISVPMVDVETTGAGGGSVAWIDKGGLLRVGPQSAGAKPGPVAYGLGGSLATLTDANLVLNRLNPDYFCGGTVPLFPEMAEEAIGRLSEELGKDPIETAIDIVNLGNGNMASAIRLVTVEKGIDPREFTIVGFGGAGGLHVSSIAEILGIRKAIVPVFPGVMSALGLLTADYRVDNIITFLMRSDMIDAKMFNDYLQRTRNYALDAIRSDDFAGQLDLFQSLEMRYYGQNYHVEVPIPEKGRLTKKDIEKAYNFFRKKHEELYGYQNPGDIVECVGMIVRIVGRNVPPKIRRIGSMSKPLVKERRQVCFGEARKTLECPIYERNSLPAGFFTEGPAIIEEIVSTTLVLPGHKMEIDEYGNIIISIRED